jgi:hypothetical protein
MGATWFALGWLRQLAADWRQINVFQEAPWKEALEFRLRSEWTKRKV